MTILEYNFFKPPLFVLLKIKAISKTKMKIYAEIGSPCPVPFSTLKERVVFRHLRHKIVGF